MDLVIDANILFAALIKVSSSSEILFSDNLHFYAPEFIFAEMDKYKDELLAKTHRNKNDFEAVLEIFKKRINSIPLEELVPFFKEAEKISPDEKDVTYLALALKLNCAILSNDQQLKIKQKTIKIYSIEELLTRIGSDKGGYWELIGNKKDG